MTCPDCEGEGTVLEVLPGDDGDCEIQTIKCERCNGKGEV